MLLQKIDHLSQLGGHKVCQLLPRALIGVSYRTLWIAFAAYQG